MVSQSDGDKSRRQCLGRQRRIKRGPDSQFKLRQESYPCARFVLRGLCVNRSQQSEAFFAKLCGSVTWREIGLWRRKFHAQSPRSAKLRKAESQQLQHTFSITTDFTPSSRRSQGSQNSS